RLPLYPLSYGAWPLKIRLRRRFSAGLRVAALRERRVRRAEVVRSAVSALRRAVRRKLLIVVAPVQRLELRGVRRIGAELHGRLDHELDRIALGLRLDGDPLAVLRLVRQRDDGARDPQLVGGIARTPTAVGERVQA